MPFKHKNGTTKRTKTFFACVIIQITPQHNRVSVSYSLLPLLQFSPLIPNFMSDGSTSFRNNAYLAFSASCSIPSFLFTSLKKGQQSQLPFFFPHIHDVWAYVTTSVLLHSSAVTFPAAFTFSTVRQQLVLQDSLTVIPIFSIVGIYISYILNRYFSPLYLFMYDKTFTAY